MKSTRRPTRLLAASATMVAACSAAGCGGTKSYSNELRPPALIVLTAAINKEEVAVSPASFGAGPVSLVITNQTGAAQEITFESAGREAGFTQKTGAINPGDTATLKANAPTGKLTVKVLGKGIAPARLTVGPKRASAQDKLLQP